MTATLQNIVSSGTIVVVSAGTGFQTSRTGNPTLPGESSVPSGKGKKSGGNGAGMGRGERVLMGLVAVVGGLVLVV